MSASTERKLRKDAVAAGTDRKTQARLEEERKNKKSKMKWTIGTIVAVILVVAILIMGSSIPYKVSTAVTINGVKYSAAEVNYYVGSQYVYFVNTYGSYASLFGLDTTYGVSGLADQEYYDGQTWLEYFTDAAIEQMTQIQAFCDYANENGITLTDDEIAEVDEEIDYIETNATTYGYKDADAYFAANYGTGVTTKIARQCLLDSQLASKAYTTYSDSLTYTDEELEEYYTGLNGADDVFSYLYYAVAAEEVTSQDEDGNDVSDVTDETMAAAEATANAILDAYENGVTAAPAAEATTETTDEEAPLEEVVTNEAAAAVALTPEERLNEAIASVGCEGTASTSSNVSGSSLSVYSDFLMDSARVAGDAAVVENSAETGYNVVVFLSRNDNHYATQSFRHILIKAEADDDGNYTDEALQTANDKAEEIYNEYLAGEQTEDAFAALANEYSEDTGSNTTGGLYENVYQGQMVSSINSFLFEEDHEAGDTAILLGQSSSYEGYHIVYYVGEGELYSTYLARTEKTNEDVSAWMENLTSGYEAVRGAGMHYVGK